MSAETWTGSSRPLRGEVAIVTGGARGIGQAYARRLARMGADVAVLDACLSLPEDGRRTVDEVEEQGVRTLEIEVDLSDEDRTDAAVRAVTEAFGPASVLVCNAGGGGGGEMWENSPLQIDIEAVRRANEANLVTTATVCRAAVPAMVERGAGKVVTVGSTSGIVPRPDGGYAHYAAAKAGVVMYTKALAREVAPYGVHANCLIPGAVETVRIARKIESVGREGVVAGIPLGRIATVEDCADVLEFLAGPLSNYVTGTVLRCDGGLAL
ncbi:SDR family NAD(P)-dependent oxidoreductase [Streptomyces colonosanans]|uniref:SDR family NAD(P)-dependent oxidoreductase n=1 Tax=Streptomyces colonosanans TaxID=1428652 RepID=UPI0015A57DAF|nr:SDR family NAD(P)-dependent oxidoreductase [Streptomyces colonosanans]